MQRTWCYAALLISVAGLPPAASATTTPDAKAVPWRTCLTEEIGVDLPSLEKRLQCGTMRVPLDHNDPSLGEIDVGLIRVRAIDENRREGALFFNVGGPGGNPRQFVSLMAAWWNTLDPADPYAGDLRRVADRYDLMAVVPRGLKGGRIYDCMANRQGIPFNDLAADLGDANWRAAERDALSVVADCTKDAFHRFVNTEQHVHDMEFARHLFGNAPLNFYGTSYGTWVGAWYGAMYPEKVGRMVFDSTMNFTRDFAFAAFAQVRGAHDVFMARAVRPAVDSPLAYGLGSDEDVLLQRVRTMPVRVRTAWIARLDDPATLAAALTMADWIKTSPSIDADGLASRIAGYTFSRDADANSRIRVAANSLAAAYAEEDPSGVEALLGTDGLSVNQAVLCNDTPWRKGSFYWRTVALNAAYNFPGGNGNEAHGALVCSSWPASGGKRPDMARLEHAPPFLIVQAEFDRATALGDALVVLDRYNHARMVVARGATEHGVLRPTASSCLLHATGTYLLTGKMPGKRLTDCDASPVRARQATNRLPGSIEQRLTRLLEGS